MDASWHRYLDVASGVTRVTRQTAETVVKALVKQGEVAADRAERTVDELLARSEGNRRAVLALVQAETERAVAALGLAQQSDLEALRARVDELERAVRFPATQSVEAPRPVPGTPASTDAGS